MARSSSHRGERWFHRMSRGLTAGAAVALLASCGAVVDPDEIAQDGPVSATGLPADVVAAGKLVVATGDYKVPTHFKNEKGELVGFNIDLSRALSRELGIAVELAAVPFDGVLAGVRSGRYDTALYNMSDSEARQEAADFVDYAVSGSVIVVRKGENPGVTTDPTSLCGRVVAVTSGDYEFSVLTTRVAELCSQAGLPAIDVQTLQNDDASRTALETGRVEALVDGMTTTPYVVAQNTEELELVGKLAVDGSEPLGMPFAKGRGELVQAVADAFRRLWQSGEYQRIAQQWALTEIVPPDAGFFAVNLGKGLDGGGNS
ncbi:ABC transporter substrate-binding protein [Pseudonocardia sp. MH-G8]|uniref:ABC transporter substrate-binding protein n=1 Tax=Pseudonocardia sp. MH-G8 TaxID=1854588 RepID=UPI001303F8FE|nr:ABC transporter substrate-binding protein [Pseudonocardia sp. MH-G8]